MKGTLLLLTLLGFTTSMNSFAQGKIGYINSTDLTESMPEMITANKAFQDFQKQKQTMLETMSSEREKKYNLYQEKHRNLSEANRALFEKELAVLEKEIQDISQRFMATEQKFQQELEEKQEVLFAPIMRKAQIAVKAVAKEKGYSYVLDTSQPGLVYFEAGDDLQQLVKTKLGINLNAGDGAIKNK